MSKYLEVYDDFGVPIIKIKLTPREQESIEDKLNIPKEQKETPLFDVIYASD
jgi:hypothetical protein